MSTDFATKTPPPTRNIDRQTLHTIWSDWLNLPVMSQKERLMHLAFVAVKGMMLSPLTTFATILTTGFSLFFFCVFLLLMNNISSTLLDVRHGVEVSIYLKDGTEESVVQKLLNEVKKYPGVSDVKRVSKAEALTLFEKLVGKNSPLIEGLDGKNPLPESLEVSFAQGTTSEEMYQRIVNDFSASNYVENVQFNSGALSQLGQLVSLVRFSAWVGTLVMLVITGLLIANAVRLAVHVHRAEIEIMELVGGTRRYIQAPFLIEGVIEGLLGAVMGIFLSYLLFQPVANIFRNSALEAAMSTQLNFLSLWLIIFVLCAGIVTGLLSSWFATRQIQVGSDR